MSCFFCAKMLYKQKQKESKVEKVEKETAILKAKPIEDLKARDYFSIQIMQSIQNRIYLIRGERVMLDFDLASLYEVETAIDKIKKIIKAKIEQYCNH